MYPERVMKALQRARANIQAGNGAAAIDDLEKAVQKAPKAYDAWLLLGQARGLLDDQAGAEACFRKATALQPRNPDGWSNLGISYSIRGLYEPALAAYARALAVAAHPHPDIVHNLGACYLQLDRYDEAVQVFKDLVLMKDSSDVWALLGMSYQGLDRYPEALAAYLKACDKGGGGYTLNLNIGTCYGVLDDQENAARYAGLALEAEPGDDVALFNQGSAYFSAGHLDEALDRFARSGLPAAKQARLLALNYVDGMDPAQLKEEHEETVRQLFGAPSTILPRGERAEGEPLRVGFVSGDFREHPVAYFLEGLLANLDRARLQPFFYSAVRREDAVTARFRAWGDPWREIFGRDDAALAEQVAADRIHILVDLAGHTNGSRIAAFIRRPAPVQATYLGYGATTGLVAMDYLLADDVIAPAGCESHYSERLVRLGPVLATYTPPTLDIPVSHLPMQGKGFPTFASFAQQRKISPATVRLWISALQAVPGARMLVMGKGLEQAANQTRFLAPFVVAGIDAARFELRGAASMEDYLAAHHGIDLILDSVPWNGHTTTLHGLWMGVPTVTIRGGTTQVARFGEMIVRAAGLEPCLAGAPEEFGKTVAALVGDPEGLASLRRGLRDRLLASDLCNHGALAQRFAAACDAMWGNYVAGR